MGEIALPYASLQQQTDVRYVFNEDLRRLITVGNLMCTMLEMLVDDHRLLEDRPEMLEGMVNGWQRRLSAYRCSVPAVATMSAGTEHP